MQTALKRFFYVFWNWRISRILKNLPLKIGQQHTSVRVPWISLIRQSERLISVLRHVFTISLLQVHISAVTCPPTLSHLSFMNPENHQGAQRLSISSRVPSHSDEPSFWRGNWSSPQQSRRCRLPEKNHFHRHRADKVPAVLRELHTAYF